MNHKNIKARLHNHKIVGVGILLTTLLSCSPVNNAFSFANVSKTDGKNMIRSSVLTENAAHMAFSPESKPNLLEINMYSCPSVFPSVTIVSLNGALNARSAEEVKQTFRNLTEQGITQVIVDLDEVPFIDSSGLAALVSGLKTLGGEASNLKLAALQSQARLLFELTMFDRVFEIYDSTRDALNSLTPEKEGDFLVEKCLSELPPKFATPNIPFSNSEVYVMQADDSLSKLAAKYYGDKSTYPKIVEATNAKAIEDNSFAVIINPNDHEIGQKLWIPEIISR